MLANCLNNTACLGSGGFSSPVVGYTASTDAPQGQLYDMVDDWREQHNVWNEHPEIVEQMKRLLANTRESGRSG